MWTTWNTNSRIQKMFVGKIMPAVWAYCGPVDRKTVAPFYSLNHNIQYYSNILICLKLGLTLNVFSYLSLLTKCTTHIQKNLIYTIIFKLRFCKTFTDVSLYVWINYIQGADSS